MERPNIDNDVYAYIKDKLVNSQFKPTVMRIFPTKGNKFPLVIIPEPRIVLHEETLKTKGEEKAYKLTYDIEIYAMDTKIENKTFSRMSVANDILKVLANEFEGKLGMLGGLPFVRENMDTNISRILVDYTCVYKNNRIYRR